MCSGPRFRKWLLVLTGILLLGSGKAGAAGTAPVGALLAREGYGVVPMERPQPDTLAVRASVNGHPARLLLDTGAWRTVLERRAAGRFGLTPLRANLRLVDFGGRRGQVDGGRAALVRAGRVPGCGRAAGVVRDLGLGTDAVSGLLGLNVLGAHGGIIHLGADRLYLIGRGQGLGWRENFEAPEPSATVAAASPFSPPRVRVLRPTMFRSRARE